MKVALVYDRVNKFGGAERVIASLHKIFPEAPLYTLVYDKESSGWSKGITVIPTFLNRFPLLRKRHEWLAPIAPLAFETLDLSAFDVVVSVTSSDAKAIITSPKQLHICYCLTPTRYFWSGEGEYLKDLKMKFLPGFIYRYLQSVDVFTSTRPDKYIAISREVQNRIERFYSRDSSIVYPAIDDKFFLTHTSSKRRREYYLLVSRLVPYKKTELAILAFNKLKKKLIVVGEGSELSNLQKMAENNISFVGRVSDERLIDYYHSAKAVIFPQNEDFGLVPLETQASGTPVIAFGKGGALETIVPNVTGLFFPKQTASSLVLAVKRFETMSFSPDACIKNAKNFSEQKFISEMSHTVNVLWKKHLLSFRSSFPTPAYIAMRSIAGR
jgi:glycosyltransferase involved in cell wall biosynthesis